MTEKELEEKLARFKEDPRSRPNLEMPARSRIAKARKLADEWHGAAVKRTRRGVVTYGRIEFLGILEPKWFGASWSDGTYSTHMATLFRNVEKVDEDEATGIPPPPEPVVIATSTGTSVAEQHNGNLLRCWDLQKLHEGRPQWRVLASLLRMHELPQAYALCLRPSSEVGSLGESLQATLQACDVNHPGELHLLDVLQPGLRYLLGTVDVDLLVLPADLRVLHVAIPVALTCVKHVIAFPIKPEWEHALYQYEWYTALRYTGRMVVQTLQSAGKPPASYMYLFVEDRRMCVDPVCGTVHPRYTRDFTFGTWHAFE
jgi:hypothetical protein